MRNIFVPVRSIVCGRVVVLFALLGPVLNILGFRCRAT